MKLIDVANNLANKYAEQLVEVEEERPTAILPPPMKAPPPPREHRSKDVVAIEHLVDELHRLDLYGRGETSYFHKLIERGESPYHIYQMLQGRISSAQTKLTECKVELSSWEPQIKPKK